MTIFYKGKIKKYSFNVVEIQQQIISIQIYLICLKSLSIMDPDSTLIFEKLMS